LVNFVLVSNCRSY